jgi:hypothetical protein
MLQNAGDYLEPEECTPRVKFAKNKAPVFVRLLAAWLQFLSMCCYITALAVGGGTAGRLDTGPQGVMYHAL